MSVFDQSSGKPPSCFGICKEKGDRQSSTPDLPHRLEDDLRSSADLQKKQEIDDMLSQALSGLTFEERKEQMEILHGVDQKVAEEETFIDACLQQLESHLDNIKSRSIYEMAEQMDPAYVKARAFRVMFLRGNRYDVKETAENMLRFFEIKRQIFGGRKLVKDITLEDLDEDDITALKSGFVQFTGSDRAGRVIHVNFPGLRGNMTLQNELRMRYYVVMSALENEENQLATAVGIVFSVGDMRDKFGGSGFFENAKLSTTLPRYFAAMHLCTDEAREYLMQGAILKATSSKQRSRCRLHFGSQTECLYKLSTYGIPPDFLPVDPNTQKINLQRHLAWVESRFAMENHDRPLPSITLNPCENDVLVGTGKTSNNIGNQRLRALVKERSQAYIDGSKDERKILIDCIINSVRESGGRFLVGGQGGPGWNIVWKEMSRRQIRKNVSQAFRNSYRLKKTNGA